MTALPGGAFGDRVRTRLRDERLVWLITVGADGTPQPNPVWFLWDGAETLLVYNRADAFRLAHVDARPQVGLHFNPDPGGNNVIVLAGTARRATGTAAPHQNPAYLAKYADAMARVSGSAAQFGADYPVPLEIDIRRVRGF